MKFKKLNESFDIGNKMTISIGSGFNADGCVIKVTDEAGNILHQEEYNYGYNASYNRKHADWAEKDYQNAINNGWKGYSRKPFIGDIVDELCAQYNIDKDSIEYVNGKNVFSDTDVSDDQVSNFISLLDECKSTTDNSDDLNEGITDSVKSAARAIAPKLKSIVNHLPEIIQGLDLVKDFYDELPEDNAVKTYLDGKGAKDVEDVYSALIGLYRVIRAALPEHKPEQIEDSSVTEDFPAQEHYIVGITTDGRRMYYNKEQCAFCDNVDDATIYPDKDSAMEDWFNIPRKGFKRIFVPIYEGKPLTEGVGSTVIREVVEALGKVLKSDPKKIVSTTKKVVDSIDDKDLDNVFDTLIKQSKNMPLPKNTLVELKNVVGGECDFSECENLKAVLDLMDIRKLIKENPETAKSILMIVLVAISLVEPTPFLEIITFIIGLIPDDIVAGILQTLQLLNPVSAAISAVNKSIDN